jgi:hypothetical protein
MCNKNISIIIGVSTGMIVGTIGLLTGASIISTILLGILIAGIIQISIIGTENVSDKKMQTEY